MLNKMVVREENIKTDTLIRYVSPALRRSLSKILQPHNQWKYFMSLILEEDSSTTKYSYDDIILAENEATLSERYGMEVVLDEWSTTGKKQPNVGQLLNILRKAQFYQAADLVSCSWLKEDAVPRPLEGPNAAITSVSRKLAEAFTEEDLAVSTRTLQAAYVGNVTVPSISFFALSAISEDFDSTDLVKGGRKIGRGGFGTVYLGIFGDGVRVAIKKLHSHDELNQSSFETEIKVLATYCHDNILRLLAYSTDGPFNCLVYSYMCNGSLEDRLACLNDTPVISWRTRIAIGVEAAKGISYLNFHGEKPMVHRDIKSANVLLDEEFHPKIGDCGLVRAGPTGQGNSTVIRTTNLLGTQVYTAPEGFRGDISTKLDTYSFGVVLLELLSGLKPFDNTRQTGHDLVSHVEEVYSDDISVLLDERAGAWDTIAAQHVASVAQDCLAEKRRRPLMSVVCADLEAIFCKLL